MEHTINHNGHYQGHITVIPPHTEVLGIVFTGRDFLLIRQNDCKALGRHTIIREGEQEAKDLKKKLLREYKVLSDTLY